MRILAFNWRDLAHPGAGGAEVYLDAVARRWVAQGHEVTVLAAAVEGRPEDEVAGGVRTLRRGGRLGVYRAARRYWKNEGIGHYDLVVDCVNTRPFMTPRFVTGVPVVAVFHQVAREVWRYETPWPVAILGRYVLEPLWLRRYKKTPVVAVSPSTRASLEYYGLGSVTVVPEGFEPATPVVNPPKEPLPTLVFVSRLSANKRPEEALEAFEVVRRSCPQARMWVIGSGPLERRLRARPAEGVSFFGHLDEAEKRDRLSRAHVLIATSVREGWGLVVTEAAALGTLAVGYDVPGLRDAIPASGGVLTSPEPAALGGEVVHQLEQLGRAGGPQPRPGGVVPWSTVAQGILAVAARGDVAPVAPARRRPSITSLRRVAAIGGVSALLFLGGTGAGPSATASVLALVAFVTLGLAVVLAVGELSRPFSRSVQVAEPGPGAEEVSGSDRRDHRWARWGWPLLVAAVASVAVHSWFRPGTLVAGGDNAPVVGMAWLDRLFAIWTGSGSNLGGPAANETSLPWAALYGLVHALGGSPMLAQQLWYAGLFVAAALSGYALLRVLRVRPVGAALGALVYVGNAHVVSDVGTNPVFLAAMVVLPALPAVVMAVASGRLRIGAGAALVGLSAPMLGYVYENPPLVLMVAGLVALTPILVRVLDGREAGRRAWLTLLGGVPLALLASAYWLVPAVLQLRSVATSTLSSPASWAWTEARATLANGFWLNNSWGWPFPAYYPYAAAYDRFPLDLAKYLLPAVAFAVLVLVPSRSRREGRAARLAVAFAGLALALVFLSTGTRAPGSVLFDLLYRLPYGWLLQDPGRFLMLAGLCYGVMVGLGTELVLARVLAVRFARREDRAFDPKVLARRVGPGLAGVVAGAVLLVPGFPLASGAISPDKRPQLPPSHVRVPAYWYEMAGALNRSSVAGNVLLLPVDDFYQMPYRWGYYGTDGFISDLVGRDLVDPSGQGYTPAASELEQAVAGVQQALLSHHFSIASDLLVAVGAPLVLVRGDVDAAFPGRHLASPRALATALAADPEAVLVRQSGPLSLFRIELPTDHRQVSYATVNSSTPNLRDLALLPPGTTLVSGDQRKGAPAVLQLPPVDHWQIEGRSLVASVRLLPGWRYEVKSSPSTGSPPVGPAPVTTNVVTRDGIATERLSYELGPSVLSDGDFTTGMWGPLGNCNAAAGTTRTAGLKARIVAVAGESFFKALLMSARGDSACEAAKLDWRAGPLLVSLSVHNVSGAPPRLCLWEQRTGRCAALPPLPAATHGWRRYQAIAAPPANAGALTLVIYADAVLPGHPTANEYAAVTVRRVPVVDQPVVVGTPLHQAVRPSSLVLARGGYSPSWTTSAPAEHVLVDGLLNGWFVRPGSKRWAPELSTASWYRDSRAVSIFGGLVVVGVLWSTRRPLRRRREGRR